MIFSPGDAPQPHRPRFAINGGDRPLYESRYAEAGVTFHLFVNLEDKKACRDLIGKMATGVQNVDDKVNFYFDNEHKAREAQTVLDLKEIPYTTKEEEQPELFEDIGQLEDVMKIQLADGNYNANDYMLGLANGMSLSHNLVTTSGLQEPEFKTGPTHEDARRLGNMLNIDFDVIPFSEFYQGIIAELKEHGDQAAELDVYPGSGHEEWLSAAKTALSHLHENPRYYTEIQKIEEFTVYDIKNRVNQVIKRTGAERKKIKGVFERGLQFIDFDPQLGIATFLAEPTHKFSADELDFQGNPKGAASAYTQELRFLEWGAWFQDWRKVTPQEFNDFLKVADVAMHCSCPAWHWIGLKYQNSQTGTAIYKTNVSDPVWAQRTGQPRGATGCKHINAAIIKLTRYPQQMLKDIQDKLK